VGPGFDFLDFTLAAEHPEIAAALRALGPAAASLI
jgi:hypothetical protein